MIESTTGEIAPFADVLASINRGALADEAAALLANLVQEVSHIGKKGRLTITIDVALFTGGGGDTIALSGHASRQAARPRPARRLSSSSTRQVRCPATTRA